MAVAVGEGEIRSAHWVADEFDKPTSFCKVLRVTNCVSAPPRSFAQIDMKQGHEVIRVVDHEGHFSKSLYGRF